MQSITKSLQSSKLVVVAVSLVLAFSLFLTLAAPAQAALTEAQIQSILSLLNSFGADAATVANVEASLRGQTPSGGTGTGTGTGTGSSVCPYVWSTNLNIGSTGQDVLMLQKFLNDNGYTIATSGAGSPGNETTYYGSLTAGGVAKLQVAQAASILAPLGLPASGAPYPFGPATRAYVNANCTTAGTGTGTGTGTTPAGTGLTVSNTGQPTNSLAPGNAASLPFTRFNVTAGNDGDVVLNSVNIKRVGLGSNNAVSGVILLDQDGNRLGNVKSLNSNDAAIIGTSVTIPRGTTRTFTVAADMASAATLGSYAGEILQFQVTGVNTSATVTGTFPITGAMHTVNATLSIGSVNARRGANDPAVATSEEVGTVGKIFSAVKLTAGSAEDVRLRSIRFDQSGSVSQSDLQNVVIVVDGVEYPTTVMDDYYTASFGSGIVIPEGLNKDIYIKGDIVDGAGRNVDFDIRRPADINVVGETYGYGITPGSDGNNTQDGGSDDGQFNTSAGDGIPPWYDAFQVTVNAGAFTLVSTNDVPAGNITNGGINVPLGSFKASVNGESVTWSEIDVRFSTSSSAQATEELIRNVTITDANGNVLAGPQDAAFSGGNYTATLSGSVTLPVGDTILIVRGNLNNNWDDGDTIQAVVPTGNIDDLEGEISGNSITPSPASTNVSGKTQTVSAAAVTVSPSSSFVSQNIIDDSSDVLLGRFTIDATQSGEDLRVATMQFRGITGTNADLDELNGLQVFKDGTALNTGSRVVDPSGNSGGADANLTFTLDGTGLVVAKGTTVTVELRGNVNASSTPNSLTTYRFDFSAGSPDWGVTGVNTGVDVSESLTSTSGATLTVASAGTVTISVDASDPSESWTVPGQEVTIGIFKFVTTNESFNLDELELAISGATSSSADFAKIALYDGSTKLLEKSFPAFTADREKFDFASALADFVIAADDDKLLTVKAIGSAIGPSKAGTSGNFLRVGTSTIHREGENLAVGQSSGTSAEILGSAGTSTGARYFRSIPTVANVSSGNVSQILANGTRELYRFSVTADPNNDVGIYKFTINFSTTSADVASIKVTELHSGKIVNSGLSYAAATGDTEVTVSNSTYGSTFIRVPAGQTYTYKVEATVSGAGTSGDSVITKLLGDAAVVSDASSIMASSTVVDADAHDDFIWSPLSTSTSPALTDNDWTNGYRVRGIEFDDLSDWAVSNS